MPHYVLCLFAGIRPGVPYGEITKLKPDAVNLENGIINISPEVSKVREERKVAIQSNLAAWLRITGLRSCGIFPRGREPSIRTLREWAKLRRIPHHKVGRFVYFDPAEVAEHIRTKLKIPARG